MNINNQLGLATHPIPVYNKSVDQQLGFIGTDGQGIMFNADGGEYWASKATPNYSDDNLIMLNEDNNFLNANGDETLLSEKEVKSRIRTIQTFRNRDYKWKSTTEPSPNQVEGAKKYYRSQFTNIDKSASNVLQSYLAKAEKDKAEWQSVENNGKDTIQYGANVSNREIDIVRNASKAKANIQALNDTIIPEIKTALEKADADAKVKAKADADAKVKADNDAFSKAKSANTIVAYTEYLKNFPEGLSADKANKSIDDIRKAEKIKALENQKANATPEEKKRIDAEIDSILGVASGTTGTVATRMFLYGGIALVSVYGLYKVFKGNSASA